jgi:glycosyltransferase involved in cell wall biosynthesis
LVSRAWAAALRLAVIGLTVRSQGSAALRVAPPADLVHAMAYMGIPAGLRLGRRDRVPVVYDARDIYVDAQNIARMPGPLRAIFARIERGWARAASRVVTVNVPYGTVMADRWGVPMPAVVLNCSSRQVAPATVPRRFHERLGLDPSARVVLYQGGFSRDRGIEQLLEAIPNVENAVLVLLGYGVLEGEIRQRIEAGHLADRAFVVPAVSPEELLGWVASADVVAMPIQPSSLNHRLTTPNKLFEAMAVGVPAVASDLPGMAAIVRETGCGVLCDPADPASIAAALRLILDAPEAERAAIRARALGAARERYNWEAQLEVLVAEYTRLTGVPW